MALPSQNTATLADIAQCLANNNTFAICGHVSPDGDCLGSELALLWALRHLGKSVVGLRAQDAPIEQDLRFLPGVETLIPADAYKGIPDVFIAVDVPNAERLGAAMGVMKRAPLSVVIDHHQPEGAIASLSMSDPDAPSTSVLVWELLSLMGFDSWDEFERSRIATCTYTGLVTDTGRFAYQNTSEKALQMAAAMVAAGAQPALVAREVYQNRTLNSVYLEERAIKHLEIFCEGKAVISWIDSQDFEQCAALRSDAEPLIDTLRSIAGISVACMMRDRGDQIRVSLRSKDETDVAAIASSFGGGGHRAAAGCTLYGSLAEARAALRQAIEATLTSPGDYE